MGQAYERCCVWSHELVARKTGLWGEKCNFLVGWGVDRGAVIDVASVPLHLFPFFSKKYLFIWLQWVLIAAYGIFDLRCGLWDPVP